MSDEIAWPEVGETYCDVSDHTRLLNITQIQKNDSKERHIIGILTDNSKKTDYSCSLITFRIIWKFKV